jgi:hypothetical protein
MRLSSFFRLKIIALSIFAPPGKGHFHIAVNVDIFTLLTQPSSSLLTLTGLVSDNGANPYWLKAYGR